MHSLPRIRRRPQKEEKKIGHMIEIDMNYSMNYSESFVKEHIEKWVNAWNNHDLKSVLSMSSDDIVNSPVRKSRSH